MLVHECRRPVAWCAPSRRRIAIRVCHRSGRRRRLAWQRPASVRLSRRPDPEKRSGHVGRVSVARGTHCVACLGSGSLGRLAASGLERLLVEVVDDGVGGSDPAAGLQAQRPRGPRPRSRRPARGSSPVVGRTAFRAEIRWRDAIAALAIGASAAILSFAIRPAPFRGRLMAAARRRRSRSRAARTRPVGPRVRRRAWPRGSPTASWVRRRP
jgi:hypothetical protein